MDCWFRLLSFVQCLIRFLVWCLIRVCIRSFIHESVFILSVCLIILMLEFFSKFKSFLLLFLCLLMTIQQCNFPTRLMTQKYILPNIHPFGVKKALFVGYISNWLFLMFWLFAIHILVDPWLMDYCESLHDRDCGYN